MQWRPQSYPVMVLVRVALLVAWGCVVPAAWCLSLPPPPAPIDPLSLAPPRHLHRLLPPDLRAAVADPPALNRLDEAQLLRELDDPTSPAAYRLQQVLSQAAEEAAGGEGGPSDVPLPAEVAAAVAAAGVGGEEPWAEPRYYVLDDFLSRGDEDGSSTDSNLSSIRKARNSLDSKSNSMNSNDAGTSSSTSSTSSGVSKRNWPHGFSRRRSGLSLSIDASMKVLREALYLEIARKKQRQQIQKAQHNKAILNSIGKRDVSAQLTHRDTPTLAERK